MKRRHRFPAKHLGMTVGQWRQQKRQEWKTVRNAIQTFTFGSAYTPVHPDLYELEKLATRISEDLEGDWIAW